MTPLAFLGLAALITMVGVLFLAVSGRKRTPWNASIDDFRQRLDALAPPTHEAIRAVDTDESRGDGRTSTGT